VVDKIRSFKDPTDRLGAWTGYGRNEAQIRDKIWHEMLNGFFYPGYWWQGFMVTHGDRKLSRAGFEMQRVIGETKGSGIGKLLIDGEWVPSAIAIHQSPASLVASNVSGLRSFVTESAFNSNLTGWSRLVRDMGYCPPTFLASEQIEKGLLTPERYPIFVLPLSQALSDAEVARLKAYVRAGGILVADARPARFHENARARPTAVLDEVFGVTSSAKRLEGVKSSIDYQPARGKRVRLPISPVEQHLKAASGKAYGSASAKAGTRAVNFGGMRVKTISKGKRTIPAFVVNAYGKGSGVYLNLMLSEYADLGKRGVEVGPLVRAIRETIERGGYTPKVRADLPVGCERVRYRRAPRRSSAFAAAWDTPAATTASRSACPPRGTSTTCAAASISGASAPSASPCRPATCASTRSNPPGARLSP